MGSEKSKIHVTRDVICLKKMHFKDVNNKDGSNIEINFKVGEGILYNWKSTNLYKMNNVNEIENDDDEI